MGPIEMVLVLVVAVAVVAAIFYIAFALRRLLKEKASQGRGPDDQSA